LADKKISQLVDGGAPQATDEFVVDRASADNFKLDWASLKAAAEADAVLDGDAAGGVLSGTYPDPGFAVDMATQAELDVVSTVANAAVPKALYDANTVLAANTDDTPAALTMGASTILARLAAGNIKAASVAEILTLLGNPYVPGGTDVPVADGGTGASTAAGARTNLAAAPLAATYIVQTADSELSAEQALGSLATGILKNTTTTGVLSIAAAGTDYGAVGAGVGIYGDGSDGTVTFDGSTTILGMAPVGSVYTLTRDIFLAAGTINTGVTIITAGFRIFCAGTLTGAGTALIHCNGTAAVAGTKGIGRFNSVGTINVTNTSAGGLASSGGNGGTGAGTAGDACTGFSMGAAGGAGGLGSGGAGAVAGTINAIAASAQLMRALPNALMSLFRNGDTWSRPSGGTGGGGGGGDGASGGGGGGGGGIVICSIKAFAGAGAIQARGGNGGNGAGTNCGGGGGGGGGAVIVVSQSVTAGAVSGWAIDANKGTGGTKTGTGVAGSDGTNGTSIILAN
jgi:hypothetical protein